MRPLINRYILCIAILSIVFLQISSAIPPLPSEFYGNIQIDEKPAQVGLMVIAKLDNKECGNITVKKEGIYGGESTFDQRLIVSCGDVPVSGTVTFWVNGNCADKAAVLSAGSSQKIDLNVRTGNKAPSIVVTPGENENIFSNSVPTKKATFTVIPIIVSILLICIFMRRKL